MTHTVLGGKSPSSNHGVHPTHELLAAKRRLLAMQGCPRWTWHGLRRTCGTYLTCSPGIFGAASAYMSGKQLGHSVTIAERHYTGVIKIPPEAKTLEQAMGLV